MAPYRIGIDVGGTFTDFAVVDASGRQWVHKTPSTPHDPSIAVLEGLAEVAAQRAVDMASFLDQVDTIVHGTTVATNTLLTRNGARVGLVTTAGFRDVLQMRRGLRESRYDNTEAAPLPLVPRERRLGVRERIGFDGATLRPMERADLAAAARTFRAQGVLAVAISLMHAYVEPAHEQEAAAYFRAAMPDAFVSTSSDLVPRIGFYERTSATVINSYVGPSLSGYLARLQDRLRQAGFPGRLLVMQSNGGVAVPEICMARPASTVLSGPAAGPLLGIDILRRHGFADGVIVDMGGTSFDVALVREGRALTTDEGVIDRLHLGLPMLQILTIGAGGGSIGWIDAGGLLRMGPGSAGADPGPACYGRGGSEPTCTDANLVLGYLDPDFFLGGRLRLNSALAEAAIGEHLAGPLQQSVTEAAAGMVKVITTSMAAAIREVSVQQGIDPRQLPLVVGGGAGPIHAGAIARELDMPLVIIPHHSSVLCAAGALLTDFTHDYIRTCVGSLQTLDWARLADLAGEMGDEAITTLGVEGIPPDAVTLDWALDMRYAGQHDTARVPVAQPELDGRHGGAITARFHEVHDRLYGYSLTQTETEVELVNLRLTARGRTPKHDEAPLPLAGEAATAKGTRLVWDPDLRGFRQAPVYDGNALTHGHRLAGPAVVETLITTIIVPGGFELVCDQWGSFVLHSLTGSSLSL